MSRWHTLSDLSQLKGIKERSRDNPVVIFKHSTRCGQSAMVKEQLEENWHFDEQTVPFYYLDIIAHRTISDQIADEFGIQHQSPQLLLIIDGKCEYHTSHNAISVNALEQHLPTFQS